MPILQWKVSDTDAREIWVYCFEPFRQHMPRHIWHTQINQSDIVSAGLEVFECSLCFKKEGDPPNVFEHDGNCLANHWHIIYDEDLHWVLVSWVGDGEAGNEKYDLNNYHFLHDLTLNLKSQ